MLKEIAVNWRAWAEGKGDDTEDKSYEELRVLGLFHN
jgi:hypothetical protein